MTAVSGMTIAIEPMTTLGSERVYSAEDNWTILTYDGSWSAHFEHTVLITETGAEILTTLIPESQLIVYPGIGHLILIENPNEFVNDIVKFLNN